MTNESMTPEQIVSRLMYRDGLMLIIDKPAGVAVQGARRARRRESGGLVRRVALRPAAHPCAGAPAG